MEEFKRCIHGDVRTSVDEQKAQTLEKGAQLANELLLRVRKSGNLLDAHVMVIKYWCPDLFLGSGSKQSTMILLLDGS